MFVGRVLLFLVLATLIVAKDVSLKFVLGVELKIQGESKLFYHFFEKCLLDPSMYFWKIVKGEQGEFFWKNGRIILTHPI